MRELRLVDCTPEDEICLTEYVAGFASKQCARQMLDGRQPRTSRYVELWVKALNFTCCKIAVHALLVAAYGLCVMSN